MRVYIKTIENKFNCLSVTRKLSPEYSVIFVMLTRIPRVMHTVLCFLCTLHAIERRAGISRGMNIDEHTSMYTLSLIESSSSTH